MAANLPISISVFAANKTFRIWFCASDLRERCRLPPMLNFRTASQILKPQYFIWTSINRLCSHVLRKPILGRSTLMAFFADPPTASRRSPTTPIRAPSCVTMPRARKQADEAVWQLLGLSPGSGRTLDDGAFGLLWVGQRASFGVPVPGPAASSVLNSAIEAEVGALIGGERARQAVDSISTELRRYLTDTDRPRSDGPLHRALRELDHWQTAETEAQTKLTALDQHFTTLLQLRQRHQALIDPGTNGQLAQELAEATNSLSAARASAQEILRFEAEESGAKRAVEGASQRLK